MSNLTTLEEHDLKKQIRLHKQHRKKLFGGRCCYCGSDPDSDYSREKPNYLTLDHFIPRHRGGRHSFDNLVPACLQCNSDKGCELPDDWFVRQSFFSLEQWRRILSHVGDFEIQQLARRLEKLDPSSNVTIDEVRSLAFFLEKVSA
jgi:CRISPR/Cas system Type II protein with McrA/HNH and RuvC-like nuclease domain